MPILDLNRRPIVLFDAGNVDHRRWFAEFARTSSWSSCPVRFAVTDDRGVHENLAVMIGKQVTEFYLGQEFKPKRKSYYKRKTDKK